jgi:hypothetical protein
MQIDDLVDSIRKAIDNHADALKEIGDSQTKLLELASVTGVVQHFKSLGFEATVSNPSGTTFRVKTSTRGLPWNFSSFSVQRGNEKLEVHMNLSVRSARDEGIYCVDVAVTAAGAVVRPPKGDKWVCIDNESLITFAEAKKLVIYPMLLAHFIGIVHEVKPKYLSASDGNIFEGLPPVLITLGNYSGNSKSIVSNYSTRDISIVIAENYDIRLARVRSGSFNSPFPEVSGEMKTGKTDFSGF